MRGSYFAFVVLDTQGSPRFVGVGQDTAMQALYHSIPDSPQVQETYDSLQAVKEPSKNLVFKVGRDQIPLLRTLAQQIRDIVAPGKHYPIKGYKHMCPWTANALEHLAGHLNDFWSGRV
jgi:hypothetical protein